MAAEAEIEVGKLFRHKGGKIYKVCKDYRTNEPRWGRDPKGEIIWTGNLGQRPIDKSRIVCVQWQVNEKYPEGREYQADRTLKLKDLTAL
jgi:hypothetical protein